MLIVEDGTGLDDADSYNSVAAFEAWCEGRNIDLSAYSDEAVEAAARRATTYIDSTYEGKWPGTRLMGRAQVLAWPRENAVDRAGVEILEDEVPREVRYAHFEAWILELQTPDTLVPVVVSSTSGVAKRVKVGPIEEEFFEGATMATAGRVTVVPIIENLLSSLLGRPQDGSGFLMRA